MNRCFRKAVETLYPKLERLLKQPPYKRGARLPKEGVYLFSKGEKYWYVGRSNNIPRRRREHTIPSGSDNQASFAALIARRKLRLPPADYRPGSQRKRLSNAKYQKAFRKAKNLVRTMEFRAVEEKDQTRQALLEIYCAFALRTRYNDFKTH